MAFVLNSPPQVGAAEAPAADVEVPSAWPPAWPPGWSPLERAVRVTGAADLVGVLESRDPDGGQLAGALVRVRFRREATPEQRLGLRLADLVADVLPQEARGRACAVASVTHLIGGAEAVASVSIG